MSKHFTAITQTEKTDSSLSIKTKEADILIEGISRNIIRLRMQYTSSLFEYRSYSIEKELPKRNLIVSEKDSYITADAGGVSLRVHKSPFAITLLDEGGRVLSEGKSVSYTDDYLTDTREASEEYDFFALGERITPLGRRGYNTINRNTDDYRYHNETTEKMYLSMPFMIASGAGVKPWAYFLDTSYKSEFDTGSKKWSEINITAHSGEFCAYFITGENIAEIMREYTSLTGKHAMPPLWALGFNQCRWSYMDEEEALSIAKMFREKDIPCDVLWYDIDYMDNFKVFTFDKERFGNVKKHFSEIDKLGFKKIVIVDPGVKVEEEGKYSVFDEGTKNGHFIKTENGEDYVGKVWPGGTKFPDFTKKETREWWGDNHKIYYDLGVDGFWNDMNEPSDFAADDGHVPDNLTVFDDGRHSPMSRIHNVYGLFEAKATVNAMRRIAENKRPFLLTRAGFAGIQKYSAVWAGDNTSTWGHLKDSIAQVINMGLSAVGFSGVDIGGFSGNSNGELLARWTQAGVLYPFFRNHSCKGTIHQEVWSFGEKIERICRQAIRLRYKLLPYFYQMFYLMHKEGIPILRPMFFGYENDKKTYSLNTQALLGDSFLAAPVVERGAESRIVYFPKGIWYDYQTGSKYEGGKEYLIDAPLDKLPIFVKESSIVPVITDMVKNSSDYKKDTLTIEVVSGEHSVEKDYYEDDMLTNDYEKGKFCLSQIKLSRSSLEINLSEKSSITKVRVRLFAPSIYGASVAGFSENGLWLEKEFIRNKNIRVEF